MKIFEPNRIKEIYKPAFDSSGEDNGQVTIIGGSRLFHGAPLLALTVASRIVDMVFFATPEKSVGMIAEQLKSKLFSFIWAPWPDVESYIEKSDAILIGPGFMRFGSESTPETDRDYSNHNEGRETREITEKLLKNFPKKRWVIDAGSLQVMDADWIPKEAVITPNRKEFKLLFGIDANAETVPQKAKEFSCTIVSKGPETLVCSPEECSIIEGGNPGMTKGGTGDTLAGLTVALLAKNEPFLAACAASFIAKKAADKLYERVGVGYNSDDLAQKIPEIFRELIK